MKDRKYLFNLLIHCIESKQVKATKAAHAQLLRRLSSLHLPSNSLPLTWNPLLSAYARHSLPSFALHTLSLLHSSALPLDSYALCSALAASASIGALSSGHQAHAHALKSGSASSVYVASALVHFYVQSSKLDHGIKAFDEIPLPNAVCANALLSGFVNAGCWGDALSLFCYALRTLRLEPDGYTLSAALRAFAPLSALELGRQVHAFCTRRAAQMASDVHLQSSLIEMYSQCGLVDRARHVFDLGGNGRDVVIWTSMLGAYAKSGMSEEAIKLFEEMLKQGVKPDHVAFVTVLTACSHSGDLNRGLKHFESIAREFGLAPWPELSCCMVDMLCRAGKVEKAWELADEMGRCGNVSVSAWGALLNACKDCGNVEMGRKAAERALELDPHNAGIYVVLSNLYAGAEMWEEIRELRELMKERRLIKDVGCSWIESPVC